ncbi:MAG: hypothetical protein KGI97_06360 [Alphaproteobacteria bacterium]|nr:hypothetical protein [Alphaproteobacteria bacterium]
MTVKTTKDSRKTPQSQQQRFIDAARKAECDESEAAFEGKLKRIAKASVSEKSEPKRRKSNAQRK